MAAPHPEHELARLRRALQGGVPRVVVITGPSDYFRAAAVELVRAALPEARDVRSIGGEHDTDGTELQDLRGASLFGAGCTLLVRRADAWLKHHGQAVLELLPKMPARCGLVVEAAKLDRRTKLGKALGADTGALFELRALYTEPYDRARSPLEAEMVGWIQARATSLGVPLTAEAAYLLMSTAGKDPGECVAELERLLGRTGKAARALGPRDLQAALSFGYESTPFELAEAVLDGDRRRAERSLEAMFRRGVKGRDGESIDSGGVFPFIGSWLYQALAQAYEGRFLLDRGVSLRDLPGRLGVRMFVERFQHHVSRNSEPRLRRGLKLLHEAQRKLRTTGEAPEWLLREFLMRYFEGDAA